MSSRVFLSVALLGLLGASATACGGTAESGSGKGTGGANGSGGVGSGGPLGSRCGLNSDCAGVLVCRSGNCQTACDENRDCPSGQRCVVTAEGHVCLLPEEAACHFTSDCPGPLVCAPDGQCRNQCQSAGDCLTGQTCADGGVCTAPDAG